MEKFYIKSKDGRVQGVLSYDTSAKEYEIDIDKNVDLSVAPALFIMASKKGMTHIDKKISMMFVKNRIVPEDRQNIDEILRHLKLKKYDTYEILKITKGKCCMDDCYIEKCEM